MTIVKPLVQLAVPPLAMAAGVALSLWILLGVLHSERLSYPARPQPAAPKQELGALEMEAVPGRTVVEIRAALIRHGYSVGPPGATFNEETLTALLAFQDNNALPVQPTCDQQCWTTLNMPMPESDAAK